MKRKTVKELYFYNGFDKPQLIEDINDFQITSNYLGDITDDFLEEYDFFLETGDDSGLFDYNIWFEPELKDLEEYNVSVGLEPDAYIEGMFS